jgi:hypothetical protein
MPAMPVATVRKMTGAMIIFTSLMNASPSGFRLAPKSGQKWPISMPAMMATDDLEIEVPVEWSLAAAARRLELQCSWCPP